MFLQYLYLLAGPLKGLKYFALYHRFIEKMLFQKHHIETKILKILNYIYIIKLFHFLYLTIMPLSDFQRALHFDALFWRAAR